LGKRILSTVLLWFGVFAVLWFFRTPGVVVVLAAMSALTLREFYRLQAGAGHSPFSKLGMAFGSLITAAPFLEARFGWPSHILLPGAVLVFCVRILTEREPQQRVDALAASVFGLVYVALLLSYLTRIATPLPGDPISANGRLLLCVWVVGVAKFCDTGALLSGMAFGRNPMAPATSPKKTWEGAIGGVAISAGVGALIAWLSRPALGDFLPPGRAAVLAVPIAIVAIISDLIESMIKRQAALKDSGNAIPGIGGVFDLTDSLLLAAPLGYMLLGLRTS
jgi:phosphatidate cytidylyltransferase